jgi:hypothetical protein
MTLPSPAATSTSDTVRTRFWLRDVSFFAGGYAIRAIVADVHPLHQAAHHSRSKLRVSVSNRRCAMARITAHTAAEEMLYPV